MLEKKNNSRPWALTFWLAVTLAVAGIIFWYSMFRPPGIGGFRINDKIAHALAYAALAFSICAAVASLRPALSSVNLLLPAIGIAMLYGISIEFIQPLFDRNCSVWDMLADLLGGGAGWGVWIGAGALAAQVGIRRRM
jgi:VanZ family protein